MKKTILIAEDDKNIRLGIKEALLAENYEVCETGRGTEVASLVRDRKPQLILLDIMLPGMSGYDICREIRSTDVSTPIIMLTAKDQEIDKVLGLELGADDYVTKPFGTRELIARIHAVLRRSQPVANQSAYQIPEEIQIGETLIRTKALRGSRGNEQIEFTDREIKVIAVLFKNTGDAISRDQLLNEVWGIDYYGTTRTLDQVIVKIRQKIEPDPSQPIFLKTVHGVGYRMDLPKG
ncbi:MAG: response regulator transcription factor [Verrucomicrobiota bacterium]